MLLFLGIITIRLWVRIFIFYLTIVFQAQSQTYSHNWEPNIDKSACTMVEGTDEVWNKRDTFDFFANYRVTDANFHEITDYLLCV